MRFKYGTRLLGTSLLLGLNTVSAQAALFDRGSGLIYDDVLKVTWLQDANYAKTSGYDADGLMTWDQAQSWAGNLVYHDSVRNVDYSDWRLASNTPINGSSFDYKFSWNGTTDWGYNITSPNAELAYMYHINLGLLGSATPTGSYQANYGIFGNNSVGGQNNVGSITNLQSYAYWSGSLYRDLPDGAWVFSTQIGAQGANSTNTQFYAWAVRPGDVAAVPVPGAVWLFGSALVSLFGFKRRGQLFKVKG